MAEIAQTPEAVAHQLMTSILGNENSWKNGRDYILSTYAECLRAASGDYKPNPSVTKAQRPDLPSAKVVRDEEGA